MGRRLVETVLLVLLVGPPIPNICGSWGLAGCAWPGEPPPLEQLIRQCDGAGGDSADLSVQLILAFDRAGEEEIVKHLGDPDERVAVAAAYSAGRWPVRRSAEASRLAAGGLADAMAGESRPRVLAAEVAAMANLLANRQGLDGGQTVDPARPLAALRSIADRKGPDDGAAHAMAADFLATRVQSARPSLGDNVYDGPGWKSVRPPVSAKPRPAKRYDPPAEPPGMISRAWKPLHAVPITDAGELHLGDVTGDGAVDYVIVHADGPAVRVSVYDHYDPLMWSWPLVGDDRPVAFPPGDLADLDGIGRAQIVYADRLGRIVVRDGAGRLMRRSEPFRTLDGGPYFGGAAPGDNGQPAANRGRIWLANFRGAGRRDLLLTNGPHLLAMTGQFQLLWHVCLESVPAGVADDMVQFVDLAGNGTDAVIRGNVAVAPDGRVLWTWPRQAGGAAVSGRFVPACRDRLAVLADSTGQVAAFDGSGPLWQVDSRLPTRRLLAGRFLGPRAGRLIGIDPPSADQGRAVLFDGLGRPIPIAPPPPTTQDKRVRIEPLPVGPSRADVLICDWAGNGFDAVWGRDHADRPDSPGWFHWPRGPAVDRPPLHGTVVGLADVDGSGIERLLCFQGKSLVIYGRP